MATQPQMIPIETTPIEGFAAAWECFQTEIAARVRDCNEISGAPLWRVTRTGGPAPRVTVTSAVRPGDLVECVCDGPRRRITCAPGPAISSPIRIFEWSSGALYCQGSEFIVRAAAAAVLDELVWDGVDDE